MTALALSLPENQDPIEQLELYMQKTLLWVKSQGSEPVPSSEFLEDTIKKRAKEQKRLTLQACFDQLQEHDTKDDPESSSGDLLTHNRQGESRVILSSFGAVTLKRKGHTKRAPAITIYPLDAALNLPKSKYSPCLTRPITYHATQGSYDSSTANVEMATSQSIPKRQAEELCIHTAADFDLFYEQKTTPSASKETLLVGSTDGKGIRMHHDSLREPTRKKAENRTNKARSPFKNEKLDAKRMAQVGAVYDKAAWKREIDSNYDSGKLRLVKSEEVEPKAINKRLWASIEKPTDEFIEEIFEEYFRRDPHKERTWLMLVDGNAHQIETIEKLAEKYQVEVPIILDVIHVIEYLWKAAPVFCKEEEDYQTWVNERYVSLLKGKDQHVASGIRSMLTKRGLSESASQHALECCIYIENHKNYMQYDDYLQADYPIGTGVIEGACRHQVKDRMGLTGARWSLKGAEAILKLRSLWTSGDFNEYWNFHQQQDRKRNHASKYKDSIVPSIYSPDELKQRNHLRIVK